MESTMEKCFGKKYKLDRHENLEALLTEMGNWVRERFSEGRKKGLKVNVS
jgi:hypothetical protein